MALIKCNKCGLDISDKEKKCPYCGTVNNMQQSNGHKNLIIVIGTLLIVLLIVGISAYYIINKMNVEKKVTEKINIDSISQDKKNDTYSVTFPYPSIDSKEKLNEALSNGKVILFIAQSSCKYSKQFSPTVDIIRNDYNLNVYLIMLDKIDFNNIMGINNDFDNYLNSDELSTPTLLLYDNGKLINSIVGQISLEELETKLKENNFI